MYPVTAFLKHGTFHLVYGRRIVPECLKLGPLIHEDSEWVVTRRKCQSLIHNLGQSGRMLSLKVSYSYSKCNLR
jgi:hypothetical protein